MIVRLSKLSLEIDEEEGGGYYFTELCQRSRTDSKCSLLALFVKELTMHEIKHFGNVDTGCGVRLLLDYHDNRADHNSRVHIMGPDRKNWCRLLHAYRLRVLIEQNLRGTFTDL